MVTDPLSNGSLEIALSGIKLDSVAEDDDPDPPKRGILSKLCLSWVIPKVIKGYSSPLSEADAPPLPRDMRSRHLTEKAQELWAVELEKKDPKLWRVVWGLARGEIIFGVSASLAQGLLNTVLKPLMLKLIIQALTSTEESDEQNTSGILLILAFALVCIFEGLTGADARHFLSDDLGTKFSVACSALIACKAGRIPPSAASAEENSLIGNDVIRTFENLKFLCNYPMCFSGVVGGVVVLLILIGWSGFVGVVVMFGIMWVNLLVAKRSKKLEELNLGKADERIGLMVQIMEGIKAIKFSAWVSCICVKERRVTARGCTMPRGQLHLIYVCTLLMPLGGDVPRRCNGCAEGRGRLHPALSILPTRHPELRPCVSCHFGLLLLPRVHSHGGQTHA
jgi:hypothetical protein